MTNAEGLDYINANFIQGFNSKKDFVATQGPKEITVGEFWQMVWEIDSPGIVMLTRLKEKKGNREVEKCYRCVNKILLHDIITILHNLLSCSFFLYPQKQSRYLALKNAPEEHGIFKVTVEASATDSDWISSRVR